MIKAEIRIKLVDEVFKLANAAQKFDGDVMLRHNNYIVDATSILGIMSINLSEPVILEIAERNEGDAMILIHQLKQEGFEIIFK